MSMTAELTKQMFRDSDHLDAMATPSAEQMMGLADQFFRLYEAGIENYLSSKLIELKA